jgi:stringent starvation protein B
MDLPPKQDVARALLLSGSVFVHLDPRTPGAQVPKWLRRQPQLVLQVGLDMTIPIPDLRVDDRGIYGTLSFNRAPFTCLVPWEAIFALAGDDGRGMVWPESMPEEISAEIEREAGKRPPPAPTLEADDEADPEPVPSGAGVVPLRPVRNPPATASVSRSKERPAPAPRSSSSQAGQGTPGRAATKGGKNLPPYLRVIK